MKITAIGSCRLIRPLRLLEEQKLISFNNAGFFNYFHTLSEVIKHINVLKKNDVYKLKLAELQLGKKNSRLFPPKVFNLKESNLIICEISSIKNFIYGKQNLQINHFKRFVCQQLKTENINEILWNKDSYPYLNTNKIDKFESLPNLSKDILKKTFLIKDDHSSFIKKIFELLSLIDIPIIFTTHFDFIEKGKFISQRHELIEWLRNYSYKNNINLFDTSKVLENYSQDLILNGHNHWTFSGEKIIAFKLLDLIYKTKNSKIIINQEKKILLNKSRNYFPSSEELAIKYIKNKQWKLALPLLEDLSKSKKVNKNKLLKNLSKTYIALGQTKKAADTLEIGIKSYSNSFYFKNLLSEKYIKNKQWKLALPLLEDLSKSKKNYKKKLLINLSKTYIALGENKKAENVLKSSINKYKDEFTFKELLAQLYYKTNKKDLALPLLESLFNSENFIMKENYFVIIAKLYFEKKCFSEAKKVLAIGVNKFPNSLKILQLYASQMFSLKEWKSAFQLLTHICNKFAYEHSSWKLKIKLQIFMGKEYDAKKNLIQIKNSFKDIDNANLFCYEISNQFHWSEEIDFLKQLKININKYKLEFFIKLVHYFFDKGDLTSTFYFLEGGLRLFNHSKDLIDYKYQIINTLNKYDLTFTSLNENHPINTNIFLYDLAFEKIFEESKNDIKDSWNIKNKIAIYIGSFIRGGAERQCLYCLKEISNDSYLREKVTCFCQKVDINLDSRLTYRDELEPINIKISEIYDQNIEDMKLDNPWMPYIEDIKKFDKNMYNLIIKMYYNFNELKPKIVNIWQDIPNIAIGLAAIMAGVPRILLFSRSLRPDSENMLHIRNDRFMHHAYQKLLSDKRVVLCLNSHAGARSFSQWLNIKIERIKVLHNCFNFESFEEFREDENDKNDDIVINKIKSLNIKKNSKIVGGIFSMRSQKRPLLWIAVAKEILKINPEIHFVLIGDGNLFESVKESINNEFIKNIHLIGETPLIKNWLKIMNFFMLTSSIEGLPNVLIESQAYGVPVISTNAGGASETFIKNKTGILVDSDDPNLIANKLLEKLFDEEWLKEARIEAMRNARNKFNPQLMFKNLKEIYGVSF